MKRHSTSARANPTILLGRCKTYFVKEEYGKAIVDCEEVFRVAPKSEEAQTIRIEIGSMLKATGEIVLDISMVFSDMIEALRVEPRTSRALAFRAEWMADRHEYDAAASYYEKALVVDPKYADAMNSYAWFLATCPDAKSRDGQRALELAKKAVELSDGEDADFIDTLAAAHAETGDFAKAIEFQQKANALEHDEEDQEKGQKRLESYHQKKPWRHK